MIIHYVPSTIIGFEDLILKERYRPEKPILHGAHVLGMSGKIEKIIKLYIYSILEGDKIYGEK